MGILIGLLKIIGIILLLLLIIIGIIIFCSINLKVYFDKNEKISYFIKLTYIFGLFSYTLTSENNIQNIKILGININKFKKNKNITKNNKEDLYEEIDEDSNKVIKSEVITEIDKNIENKINDNEEETSKSNIKESKFKKLKCKFDNLKLKINIIIEKIKFIINYPDKKEILNLCLLLLKRLLKSIKFKKIKINIDYGLDEPFKTGNICGIISAIIPFLPKKFINDIKIMPDFENQIFLGNFELKCKTSLFKILLPIILFIIKKPIRKIIFSKGE